jgi:hypothetical protein
MATTRERAGKRKFSAALARALAGAFACGDGAAAGRGGVSSLASGVRSQAIVTTAIAKAAEREDAT